MQEIVSVIVPVFNAQVYLPRCIESILSQNYPHLELILVDDGSEDESLAICHGYARQDPRIRVFHQNNQGQGVARNLGLDQAQGAYFAFVDADDALLPQTIGEMLDAIRHHGADLVICDRLLFQGRRQYQRRAYTAERIFCAESLLREYLTTPNIESTVTGKLFARRLFEGRRFPPLYMSEDACLIHVLFGRVKLAAYLPEALYLQTIHSGSTEYGPFSGRHLSRLTAEESLREYLQEEYPQLLPLISWRQVNTIASLMKKLLRRRGYFSHRQIYDQLRTALVTHWAPPEGEDHPSKTAIFAKKHPYLFFVTHFLMGYCDYGKELLKILLYGR